ncbi:uncharacterized protein G2W53_024973 [Senna tora]|uniref:Uncharacterized protein n=1 Tax=Senna tora TaxID=362788 RepID=A0A834TCK5_9FABA|nr:uncharacterized protein G2W53_024973 [Senna tora]
MPMWMMPHEGRDIIEEAVLGVGHYRGPRPMTYALTIAHH